MDKNKDLFEALGIGSTGSSAGKSKYDDMSVDDLLSQLSGGHKDDEGDKAARAAIEAAREKRRSESPQSETALPKPPAPPAEPVPESAPEDPVNAPEPELPEETVPVFAEVTETQAEAADAVPEPESSPADNGEIIRVNDSAAKKKKKSPKDRKPEKEVNTAPSQKKSSGKSLLKSILDEDPDELLNTRKDTPENGGKNSGRKGLRRRIYAVLGVIFSVLACIGLVAVITVGSRYFTLFSSGNTRRQSFEKLIYPAVIMDISSFSSPADLSSEQIITAAIWSLLMDESAVKKYHQTFDVITVPAVDVETYAVKLFGTIPALTHGNAGPSEARFYYSGDTKSYNIPVRPVVFTYRPSVKSVSRTGNEYTLNVDYIDELPGWIDETSSKSVQFVLTETNEGYQLKSMIVTAESGSL